MVGGGAGCCKGDVPHQSPSQSPVAGRQVAVGCAPAAWCSTQCTPVGELGPQRSQRQEPRDIQVTVIINLKDVRGPIPPESLVQVLPCLWTQCWDSGGEVLW